MFSETGIPLAYFITFSCYGTWLHGEKSTSVDRFNNTHGTKFLSPSRKRSALIQKQITETPYLLDEPRREIVLHAMQKVCTHRQWVLLAAHIRSNHIHCVIHALSEPEKIMNTLKIHASRYLNEAKIDSERKTRWTRHGSTRYLWKEAEVEATIQYVVHEQGLPMAVFENTDRRFYTVL